MTPFAEWFVPDWNNEIQKTRKMLVAAPDSNLDWRPHPKSMPIGTLTAHVADIAIWPKFTVDRDILDMTNAPEYKRMQLEPGGRAALLAQFDRAAEESAAAVAAASAETLSAHWKLAFGGHVVLDMPRPAVLRDVVLHHMIHHRAQLGVYLRLLDLPVPGMYGPSADEK